jgi:glycosyltransferase involved in cell wall biosynthesis
MKKIIIFIQNLSFGGVQKSASTLANYLVNFYEVSIVLAENNKKNFYKIDSRINIFSIETKKFDLSNSEVGEQIFYYRVEELEKILQCKQADLIISYEDYNNLILLSTKYLALKVVSCRNCIEKKHTQSNLIHFLDKEFYVNKIEELYPISDLIITVSREIQNEVLELIKTKNIITIYNGISNDNKTIASTNYNNFILNVARLVPQKGQKDLIIAFNIIKNKITQNLIIVGEGEYKVVLEDLIKEYGLEERVFLVGYDNPYKYINKCDLFVFPSEYEGFSNAVLEVISSQKNIVAYNYAGSSEILFEDNLCELYNVKALSNKILYFLENKDLNTKLEKQLYERSKEFTLEKTLLNYKKEIDNLCVE